LIKVFPIVYMFFRSNSSDGVNCWSQIKIAYIIIVKMTKN
jgi:hypothetical protein